MALGRPTNHARRTEDALEESFSTKLLELAKIRLTIHHNLLDTRHHSSDDLAASSTPLHEALEQWMRSWESLSSSSGGYSDLSLQEHSRNANLLFGRHNYLQATFELFSYRRARGYAPVDQNTSTATSLIENFNELYESGRDSSEITTGHEKYMIPPPTPFGGWTTEETIYKAMACLIFRKQHEVPDAAIRTMISRLLHHHTREKLLMGEMLQSLNNDTPHFSPTVTEDI